MNIPLLPLWWMWAALILSANLHAYWVFEAKIAFLMTIAASRKGAEELLDAGIFEVFSMCSFIAVQPIGSEGHGELHMLSPGGLLSSVLFCPSPMSRSMLTSRRDRLGRSCLAPASRSHLRITTPGKVTFQLAQIASFRRWSRKLRTPPSARARFPADHSTGDQLYECPQRSDPGITQGEPAIPERDRYRGMPPDRFDPGHDGAQSTFRGSGELISSCLGFLPESCDLCHASWKIWQI
jgi:hypothetical protein